jgi:hypothetical protein
MFMSHRRGLSGYPKLSQNQRTLVASEYLPDAAARKLTMRRSFRKPLNQRLN